VERPELARELAARCQIAVSASTIGRWLARNALKPWQHRSWISVRDLGFAVKAARVLNLYAGSRAGRPLGPKDYVICADEKTPIQARCRCHLQQDDERPRADAADTDTLRAASTNWNRSSRRRRSSCRVAR